MLKRQTSISGSRFLTFVGVAYLMARCLLLRRRYVTMNGFTSPFSRGLRHLCIYNVCVLSVVTKTVIFWLNALKKTKGYKAWAR